MDEDFTMMLGSKVLLKVLRSFSVKLYNINCIYNLKPLLCGFRRACVHGRHGVVS